MSVDDPIPRDLNKGPDNEHYPFGWLGAWHRVGEFVIVECREDRDHEEPDTYVIYVPTDPDSLHRREMHVWHTLPEALMAVAMLMVGTNPNTIAHLMPVLFDGLVKEASR